MSLPRELNSEEKTLLAGNPQLFKVDRTGSNPNKAGSKIKWRSEQIEFIKKDYSQNMDVKRLSLLFGTSEQAMRAWLHKFGIKTLTRTEKNRINDIRNSDYFEKIDTPDKAYWLGFLYADGGIYQKAPSWMVRINLQASDKDHLQKFLRAIESTTIDIKNSTKRTDEKEYKGVYICVADKKMVLDLIDKGCTPRKSFTVTFPTEEQVPKDLISHFIRGYFDGDGCITSSYHNGHEQKYYSVSFVGTQSILQGILKNFDKENIKITKLNDAKETAYSFHISGNKIIKNIYQYLYKDSTEDIEMSRKRNKFEALLRQ